MTSLLAAIFACSSEGGGAGQPLDSGADPGTGRDDGGRNPDASASRDGDSDHEGDASTDGGDSGTDETAYTLTTGHCFTFETASSRPYTTACGDFMALAGAMVDLFKGEGSARLCQLSGTFASLAAVPSSDETCVWSDYIEGGGGLTNAGLIVQDASGEHQYRMRILSNSLPSLKFEFAKID